jgi:ectoine hydroxylase-related dioxygenase (phytanoyl-CoA dioxygenase family)
MRISIKKLSNYLLRLIKPRGWRAVGGVQVHHEFVNRDGPLDGLICMRFFVTAGPDIGTVVNLELQSDTGEAATQAIQLADGHGKSWVGLHTHLLSDGKHQLTLSLLDAEGVQLWQGKSEFQVANPSTLARTVSSSLHNKQVNLFVTGGCSASSFDYRDEALRPWFDRPDALENITSREHSGELTATEASAFRKFVTDGYMVLENLFDDALLDGVNADIDDAVSKKYKGYEYGSSQRIEHLHLNYRNVEKLFLDRRYLDIVDKLFQSSARPCQTLTYVFGSQQDAHQDTVHLTPFPAGYMCGVWIALEDIREDSGELEVFTGSHRLPRAYMHEVNCNKVTGGDWREFIEKMVSHWKNCLDEESFPKFVYRPKKGTALIWHENLMHGGSIRRNPELSRRSIVIHCFADGAVVYYDSTGEVGHTAHRNSLRRHAASPIQP